jgi:hypothetical protein
VKKSVVLSLLGALVMSPAIAQSNFAGFYGQISTGYESNAVSNLNSPLIKSGSPYGVVSAYNQNFGGMPLVGGLGYYHSISPSWLVGLGADYSFLSQESSNFSYSVLGFPVPDGVSLPGAKIKTSNRVNIFITPGYAIDKDKLVYFKGGYTSVQVDLTDPSSITNQTKNLNGYILGLGYKQIIDGGFYGFGEANYMNYGSANFAKSSSVSGVNYSSNISSQLTSYQFLIGVGYKF